MGFHQRRLGLQFFSHPDRAHGAVWGYGSGEGVGADVACRITKKPAMSRVLAAINTGLLISRNARVAVSNLGVHT